MSANWNAIEIPFFKSWQSKQMNRQFAEAKKISKWKDAQALWLPEKLKSKWDNHFCNHQIGKLSSWRRPSVAEDVESLLQLPQEQTLIHGWWERRLRSTQPTKSALGSVFQAFSRGSVKRHVRECLLQLDRWWWELEAIWSPAPGERVGEMQGIHNKALCSG